tara:strand:- start:1262 stop:2113 length:852 start_codon:yes stop_codon:yes gene_type:complete
MLSFGKYKGRKVKDLIADKSYYQWFIKQDFIKTKYKKDYDMVKNYKEPFLNILDKHLDWDCILMVSDYLNLNNEGVMNRAFNGYAPSDSKQSKIIGGYDEHHKYWFGFKHRRNIYNLLKVKYGRHTKLNEVNFKEWDLFHHYNNEALLIGNILLNRKNKKDGLWHRDCIISNAELIYGLKLKIERPYYEELRRFCDNKIIPFGKYQKQSITWKKWDQALNYHVHHNSGNLWVCDFDCVRWKLNKYLQWVKEKNILKSYPLFKFYLDVLDIKRHNERMNRSFYD